MHSDLLRREHCIDGARLLVRSSHIEGLDAYEAVRVITYLRSAHLREV